MRAAPSADAVGRFGSRLLGELGAGSAENVVLSPCSLAFSLATVLDGAGGRTREQLAGVLGVAGLPDAERARRFRALRAALLRPAGPVEVDLAAAVWTGRGAVLDADFLRRAEEGSAAEVRTLAAGGPAAAAAVNAWVSDRTKGRIPWLVGAEDLATGPGCVLTDAVYFTGRWALPFDPRATRGGPFTLLDGRTTEVPMMVRSGRLGHLETDDFQAVALDYAGGALGMYVVLPRPGRSPDLARWADSLAGFRLVQVALHLPRFSVTTALDLVGPLTALGMGDAFAPGADFSRMGLPGAFISAFRHTARIDVDEKGTEAAAGTAVVLGRTLEHKVSMIVDRPFLLAVVERRSGLPLFVGRISDPEPNRSI